MPTIILLLITLSGAFLTLKAVKETNSDIKLFLNFRERGFNEADYSPECSCEDCLQEEKQNTPEETRSWKFEAYKKTRNAMLENLFLNLAYTVFLMSITLGAEYYLLNNFK